jgi:SAM-dependent methyltransferase
VNARYDGHAEWYDTTFRGLGDESGSAGLLGRLLGPADVDRYLCLDVGCGTGLHFAAVAARGYTVVGVDLSADQLRIAASRNVRIVRADAARLPLPDASVPAVVMTFIHTDVDDFPATVAEAARVLRPGGRLIYLGLHPGYVGAFADRQAEGESHEVRIGVGYGDERLRRDASGRFPVRSRVGARNLTLQTLVGAFLNQQTLRLTSLVELDTAMRPWRSEPRDGRVVRGTSRLSRVPRTSVQCALTLGVAAVQDRSHLGADVHSTALQVRPSATGHRHPSAAVAILLGIALSAARTYRGGCAVDGDGGRLIRDAT